MMKSVALFLTLLTLANCDLSSDMLTIHNKFRADLGTNDLTWASDLEVSAQKWADHLASTGNFEHSYGSLGENIAWQTSAQDSAPTMANGWASERKNCDLTKRYPDVGPCGHYTQMVWQVTREVGCALATGNGDYLVCQYRPGGNFDGNFVYVKTKSTTTPTPVPTPTPTATSEPQVTQAPSVQPTQASTSQTEPQTGTSSNQTSQSSDSNLATDSSSQQNRRNKSSRGGQSQSQGGYDSSQNSFDQSQYSQNQSRDSEYGSQGSRTQSQYNGDRRYRRDRYQNNQYGSQDTGNDTQSQSQSFSSSPDSSQSEYSQDQSQDSRRRRRGGNNFRGN